MTELKIVDGEGIGRLSPDVPTTDMIDIRAIQHHPENWHTHPDVQIKELRRSLDEFGVIAPCTWNMRTGRLLDGHARFVIAVEDGKTHLYCRIVNWDDRKEKRYMLAVDKITSLAGVDEDRLAHLLSEFQDDPDGLPPGWDTVVVDDLSQITDAEEAELEALKQQMQQATEAPEAPEAPDIAKVPARSKDGDIYRIGDHVVMCGDSLDPANIALALHHAQASAVDAMFTDPPYQGNFGKFVFPDRDGKKTERKFTARVKDKKIDKFDPDARFLPSLRYWFGWQDEIPLADDKLNCFVFCNDILQLPYLRWCSMANGRWATLVWEKQQPPPKAGSHWIDCEYLIWMHKNNPTWNDKDKAPDAYRKKVLHFNRSAIAKEQKDSGEPTPKPVELVQNQLALTTAPGDVICDPFCGTGTTGIACQSLGRRAILMDIDPRSVDCTVVWLEAMTGLTAELVTNVYGSDDTSTANATAE